MWNKNLLPPPMTFFVKKKSKECSLVDAWIASQMWRLYRLSLRVLLHLDRFALFQNWWYVPNRFVYFSWVVLGSHYVTVKRDQSTHTLAGLFLHPLRPDFPDIRHQSVTKTVTFMKSGINEWRRGTELLCPTVQPWRPKKYSDQLAKSRPSSNETDKIT